MVNEAPTQPVYTCTKTETQGMTVTIALEGSSNNVMKWTLTERVTVTMTGRVIVGDSNTQNGSDGGRNSELLVEVQTVAVMVTEAPTVVVISMMIVVVVPKAATVFRTNRFQGPPRDMCCFH